MLTKILLVALYITNCMSPSSVGGANIDEINRFITKEEARLQKEVETNSILDSSENNFDSIESVEVTKFKKTYFPLVYWHGMGNNWMHNLVLIN